MRLRSAPLAVGLALSVASAALASGHWTVAKGRRGVRATADGRAETPSGEVPAVLRVLCRKQDAGAICVSLKLEEAAKIEGFDPAAFTGGRSGRVLHATTGGDFALDAPIEGHWAQDPVGSFAFDLCGDARGESDAARLARAIASGSGDVELRIEHATGDGREIRARFPGDDSERAVRDVLRRCGAR